MTRSSSEPFERPGAPERNEGDERGQRALIALGLVWFCVLLAVGPYAMPVRAPVAFAHALVSGASTWLWMLLIAVVAAEMGASRNNPELRSAWLIVAVGTLIRLATTPAFAAVIDATIGFDPTDDVLGIRWLGVVGAITLAVGGVLGVRALAIVNPPSGPGHAPELARDEAGTDADSSYQRLRLGLAAVCLAPLAADVARLVPPFPDDAVPRFAVAPFGLFLLAAWSRSGVSSVRGAWLVLLALGAAGAGLVGVLLETIQQVSVPDAHVWWATGMLVVAVVVALAGVVWTARRHVLGTTLLLIVACLLLVGYGWPRLVDGDPTGVDLSRGLYHVALLCGVVAVARPAFALGRRRESRADVLLSLVGAAVVIAIVQLVRTLPVVNAGDIHAFSLTPAVGATAVVVALGVPTTWLLNQEHQGPSTLVSGLFGFSLAALSLVGLIVYLVGGTPALDVRPTLVLLGSVGLVLTLQGHGIDAELEPLSSPIAQRLRTGLWLAAAASVVAAVIMTLPVLSFVPASLLDSLVPWFQLVGGVSGTLLLVALVMLAWSSCGRTSLWAWTGVAAVLLTLMTGMGPASAWALLGVEGAVLLMPAYEIAWLLAVRAVALRIAPRDWLADISLQGATVLLIVAPLLTLWSSDTSTPSAVSELPVGSAAVVVAMAASACGMIRTALRSRRDPGGRG